MMIETKQATYPWRSAHDGEEETPLFQWNPLSDRWMPDHTDIQRHIGAIVAYDNNTYTNVMAVWVLQHVPRVLEQLPSERQQALRQTLGLDEAELAHWNEVSRRMRIVFQDDGQLSQFAGYDRLKEFDLGQFRQHGDQRLDWVLEAQHDTVDRYQVTKQADTALLLYLFTPAELNALLERLGYAVDQAVYQHTIEEQLARTVHASTLSRMVYAGALLRIGDDRAHTLFEEAQRVDLQPRDEGTAEGIHLGAMGGTLATLQHHYLGLRVQAEHLEVDPNLPPFINQVRTSVTFRGAWLSFDVDRTHLMVYADPQNDTSVRISYRNQLRLLEPGTSVRFDIF